MQAQELAQKLYAFKKERNIPWSKVAKKLGVTEQSIFRVTKHGLESPKIERALSSYRINIAPPEEPVIPTVRVAFAVKTIGDLVSKAKEHKEIVLDLGGDMYKVTKL